MRRSHPAFTIVELLVVVTIIVILLALMAPAMEAAIYQSELARCGADMKAISSGSLAYAVGNRRMYLDRDVLKSTRDEDGVFPMALNAQKSNTDPNSYYRDDRARIKAYIPLAALADPLAGKVNFDFGAANNASGILACKQLWFGWGYRIIQGGNTVSQSGVTKNVGGTLETWKPMRKLGDRWTWSGQAPTDPGPRNRSSSLLASDMDGVTEFGTAEGGNMASHPDDQQVMSLKTYQNQSNTFAVVVSSSWGVANAGKKRGKIDNNYAHDDGSVVRFTGIVSDDQRPGKIVHDERVIAVPVTSAGVGIFNYYFNIPKE